MMIDKTDYEEPRCPMDNSMWVKKPVHAIPKDRIIAKEDEYLSQNDFDSAKKHLLYWLEEAENGHDDGGKLLLYNELMGLHRKLGQAEQAKQFAQKALALVQTLGLQETIGGATAYLNTATVCKAFGEAEQSLIYFETAKQIYETKLEPNDIRKAGLYNNMALTLVDLKRYDEAIELYQSAIAVNQNNALHGEEAITWLNLADCVLAQKGVETAEEMIAPYLHMAESLLDSVPNADWDGNYAYILEKCAPAFDYYGYFMAAKRFRKRAETIYIENKESRG